MINELAPTKPVEISLAEKIPLLLTIVTTPENVKIADDDTLIDLGAIAIAVDRVLNDVTKPAMRLIKRELGKRMVSLKAKRLPHVRFNVTLDPKFSKYIPNVDALVEIANELPPDEASKIVTFVPEQVIPAHYEAGNSTSILSIANAYGEHEYGKRIRDAMKREELEPDVIIEPREKSAKVTRPAA